MGKKKLPIEKPPVYGYQFYAYPLAIILNHEEAYPWFYSNYIQVAFDKEFKSPVPFCFYMYDHTICPWLKVQKLQRDLIKFTNQDIIDFVIKSLNENYYVYLNVDEYYIPDRRTYKKRHFSHDILVYGYDINSETFDVLGFNKNVSFKSSKVSFSEFRKSYLYLENIENECNQVYLYKFNPEGEYEFNKKLVIESLEDYLHSRNTSEKFSMLLEPWERFYGMESYKQLYNYFEALIQGEVYIDIRNTHILWEHKKVMASRINFMLENQIIETKIYQDAKKIEDRALIIRNMFVKYSLVKDNDIILKIVDRLEGLKNDEEKLIKDLINALKI